MDIEASRSYIYGYWCGQVGATRRIPLEPMFAMGYEDGSEDALNGVDSFVVSGNVGRWANLNQDGFRLGSFSVPPGLRLWFDANSATMEAIAVHITVWNSTPYKSSGMPRGWVDYK